MFQKISFIWINTFIISLIFYCHFLFGSASAIYLTVIYFLIFLVNHFKKNNLIVFFLVIIFCLQPFVSLLLNWQNLTSDKAKFFFLLSSLVVQFFITFFVILFLCFYQKNQKYTQENNENLAKINFWFPLIFICSLNIFFILANFEPIEVDAARHSLNSLKIFDLLFVEKNLIKVFFFYDFYGPIVYIVGAIFMLIFGKNETALNLSIAVFWLPLAYVSLYHFILDFFYKSKNKITQVNDDKAKSSLITFIFNWFSSGHRNE